MKRARALRVARDRAEVRAAVGAADGEQHPDAGLVRAAGQFAARQVARCLERAACVGGHERVADVRECRVVYLRGIKPARPRGVVAEHDGAGCFGDRLHVLRQGARAGTAHASASAAACQIGVFMGDMLSPPEPACNRVVCRGRRVRKATALHRVRFPTVRTLRKWAAGFPVGTRPSCSPMRTKWCATVPRRTISRRPKTIRLQLGARTGKRVLAW